MICRSSTITYTSSWVWPESNSHQSTPPTSFDKIIKQIPEGKRINDQKLIQMAHRYPNNGELGEIDRGGVKISTY